MRPKGGPQELERRRRRAMEFLDRGLWPGEVAERVGVDRRSVRRWKAAYREKGPEALKARPVPGRPPKLTGNGKQELEELLLEGAEAAGFDTELWTCPRVAKLIRKHFGVRYHVGIISVGCCVPWGGAHRGPSAGPGSVMRRRSRGGSRRTGRASKKSLAAEGLAGLPGRDGLSHGSPGASRLAATHLPGGAAPAYPSASEGVGHRGAVRGSRT